MKTGQLHGLLQQPIRFPRWVKVTWLCISAIVFVRIGLIQFGFTSLFNTWGYFVTDIFHPLSGWEILSWWDVLDCVFSTFFLGLLFFALLVLVSAVLFAVALCLAWPFTAVLAVLAALSRRTASTRTANDEAQAIPVENKASKMRLFILAGILVALLVYLPWDFAYRRYAIRRDALLMDAYYQLRPREMTQADVLKLLGKPDWKRDSVLGYCLYRPSGSSLFMLGQALFGDLSTTAVTFSFDSKEMLVGRFHILSSGRRMGHDDIYNELLKNERSRDYFGGSPQYPSWATDIAQRKLPGVKFINVSCSPSTGNVAFADRRVYDASVTYEQSGTVRQVGFQFAEDRGNIESPSEWKDEELPQGQTQ